MATATRVSRADLLTEAIEIAQEYMGNLTLRQLYYQLVARGHSPNSQEDYTRIGNVLIDARIAGTFRFDWLIDRSRTIHEGDFNDRAADVDDALRAAATDVKNLPYWNLRADRWWGQRTHVSVWVEKEALSGVFEEPCKELGVSWFACKGYPSLSSLYNWVRSVSSTVEESDLEEWGGLDSVVILYFGDHDPDGWQIPRSALRRVNQIQDVTGLFLPEVTLDRVALNMDQILAHRPPPFPAKVTSARYAGYVAEHDTTSAWELDALTPPQLQRLIRDGVNAHFDTDRHTEVQAFIREQRVEMRKRMRSDDWLAQALEG